MNETAEQHSEPVLTVDKLLALAASLRGPEKPPVFLVTGLVTGCWRAEKDGQEYFIIDRATEDQVRRALTTNASRQDGSLPYYQGMEFEEDETLVAQLFTDKLEDYFLHGDGTGTPVGFWPNGRL